MPFDFKNHDDDLLFVPLGGSNEIGMNLNLYRYKGKWIMIDLGIGFADAYLPGIDIVVPNMDAFLPFKKDLVALVLTHAHEDHLGAVPYLWHELECPIYATPFTANLLRVKMAEEGLKNRAKIIEVEAGKLYDLAPFTFEMVPITHSIPEMHAVALRTDAGTVMHTGDWKLDANPMVGPTTDEATLAKYGDEGVLAMVCDSTNVFVEGESGSEGDVRASLRDIINDCDNRVIVTTFASNVARLESIIYAALDAGRSVALSGKSLWRVTAAAKEAGYLQDVPPFLDDEAAIQMPKNKVVFICTGCQGEGRAAMAKIARGEHPYIRLTPKDTIIFSSRTIPGNEQKIGWMHNKFIKMGLEVINDHVGFTHVSGHPARMELERMYQLVRPKIAVPVHGEARHIHEHAKLAESLQVPEQVEPYNGAVIRLKEGEARIVGTIESGYLAMDGSSLIDTNSPVIRTRRKIRDDGFCGVSLVLDKKGALVGRPKFSAPGCLDSQEDRAMFEAMTEEIEAILDKRGGKVKLHQLEESIRNVLRRMISEELGKKPVLDVHLHQL
ncbi:MAG: ribonuclease J [Alphaproteobacteria bacterium]|nr:ribonuclease J [Alphaproteobacteria bacterium]